MLNSGELMMIRNSDIPNHVVAPFVRRGETVDIAKRDLVTNCFLERKPPDLLTFGHKSFGEFLAARRLLDLATKEGSLDAEVKSSSLEVWQFLNELAPADGLDAIFEAPDRNANSITLILGIEILEKLNSFSHRLNAERRTYHLTYLMSEKPIQMTRINQMIGSAPIFDKAFPAQNIRASWRRDSLGNGGDFWKRINILKFALSPHEWLSPPQDVIDSLTPGIHFRMSGLTWYEVLRKTMDIRSEIRSWYSR